jgi:tetratricopeptide (TPR) repeat protein
MLSLRSSALLGALLLLPATARGARHETWIEVRSPHFIVVSNAGDSDARKVAVQFEQVRSLFRGVITIAQNAPSPVITIFAVKDEDSLRELLPEYWTKGHTHPAGIFFSRLGQYYAAVVISAEGENPYETLYHEYYHSLTLPYFPAIPVWLAEGLAEFFGNSRITDKVAYTGQASESLVAELRQNRLIPLDVLFKVDHSSPYYNEQEKTSEFYAESWALTHYFMLADKAAHRQLLVNYLSAIGAGATEQEAASKAFGDLEVLQKSLQKYVSNYQFYDLETPAPPKVPDADLHSRTLSTADVDAYWGGFDAVRGHTQDAITRLEEAVRLDPKLPLAYQNLAIAELFGGQQNEALTYVSQSIALDPGNPVSRYLRAYLTMNGSRQSLPSDPQVEDDLRLSISASPDFAPPYGLLATYLAVRRDRLPEALSLAQKAVALEPGTSTYWIALAQVLGRMQRYDDARTAALHARASSIGPDQIARADTVLAALQSVQHMQTDVEAATAGEDPGAGGPAHGSQPNSTPKQDSEDVSGSRKTLEVTGVVTQSSCNPATQLQVTTSTGTYRLYCLPGARFGIEMATKPPAEFNPCSSFRGLRVKVQYEPDGDNPRSGQIKSVDVLESGSQ